MSKNPPAFPVQWDYAENETGMTLRDWFAGQCSPQCVAVVNNDPTLKGCSRLELCGHVSDLAYQMADAMLATRSAP